MVVRTGGTCGYGTRELEAVRFAAKYFADNLYQAKDFKIRGANISENVSSQHMCNIHEALFVDIAVGGAVDQSVYIVLATPHGETVTTK